MQPRGYQEQEGYISTVFTWAKMLCFPELISQVKVLHQCGSSVSGT